MFENARNSSLSDPAASPPVSSPASAPASPAGPPFGRLLSLFIAALSIVQGLGSLVYPYGRDQGNYAYAGWVWWTGGALYRDVFVFKPPLTAVVHGLAIGLFGVNMVSIRYVDLAWHAGVSVLVSLITFQVSRSRAAAVVAGLLYPYFYWQVEYWDTAQTDGFLNLPALFALWLGLAGIEDWNSNQARPALARWFGAGVAAAVAMAFKYTAGVIAAPMMLAVLLVATQTWRALGSAVAAAALGILVGGGAVLLWLWSSGAWDAFWDVQLNMLPGYVTETGATFGFADAIDRCFDTMWERWTLRPALIGLMFLPIPAAFLLIFGTAAERRGMWIALAWLFAGAASLFLQGRFHTYHYLMAYPPIAVTLALGWSPWFSRLVRLGRSRAAQGTILVALIVILTPSLVYVSRLPGHQTRFWKVVSGKQTLLQHWAKDGRYDQHDYDTGDILELSAYLDQITQPDERVFVWGFDPTIHIVAERMGVSRFLYNYPFRVAFANPAYVSELLGALRDNPPKVFVVGSKDSTSKVSGSHMDSRKMLLKFKALHQFVDDGYVLDRTITRYDVYLPKPKP